MGGVSFAIEYISKGRSSEVVSMEEFMHESTLGSIQYLNFNKLEKNYFAYLPKDSCSISWFNVDYHYYLSFV